MFLNFLQLEINCFWWSLLTNTGKNVFFRSITPKDVNICTSNETTSSIAVAVGKITWLSYGHSLSLPRIHFFFSHRTNGEEVEIIILASFKC